MANHTFFRIALAVSLTCPLIHAQTQDSDLQKQPAKRLVGDYDSGSKFNDPPYSAAQIPYSKLTHIIHSGVGFDASGNLQVPVNSSSPPWSPAPTPSEQKSCCSLAETRPALKAIPAPSLCWSRT